MKIGIGIDTGGTCTDGVVYQLEERKVLAYGKTGTTKEDLSIGIGRVLDTLPGELVRQAEVIALSTTLATNACVENKGGRAKLVLFGIDPATVRRVGEAYGLPMDDSLVFVACKTKPNGEVVSPPDWQAFRDGLHQQFDSCEALGVVEMFARRSGAALEKQARDIIAQELGIPVVCGHELFSENNMVKRGASALLNARLIPVIKAFLNAVRRALDARGIKAPFVIVRSDGSLMTERFTQTRPVETLLCGPVASVMGAVELTDEREAMIVDIGGTTTDVAFVKDGTPERAEHGVRIGKWDTFVKGLFVDTFGLGGDSGVVVTNDLELELEAEKVIPLCMAASRYPALRKHLEREDARGHRVSTQQHQIYLAIRQIEGNPAYTREEQAMAALFAQPQSLEQAGARKGDYILKSNLERLIREGVLVRCGVTPTDVMHVKGDFTMYDVQAARYGLNVMARMLHRSVEETCDLIYDEVKRKLYFNLVRILVEDAYPAMREAGIGPQVEALINDAYRRARTGAGGGVLDLRFAAKTALISVGAPTKLFLEDVGALLGARVVTSQYAPVANALGAVVGNVRACVEAEVVYEQEDDTYLVVGGGERHIYEDLDAAKQAAEALAVRLSRREAIERGADEEALKVEVHVKESVVDTAFGPLYMGYKVQAAASGKLRLV